MFYYKKITNGSITSVESKSVDVPSPKFISATEAEYNAFITSLPVPEPVVVRDYGKEIDDLRAKIGG